MGLFKRFSSSSLDKSKSVSIFSHWNSSSKFDTTVDVREMREKKLKRILPNPDASNYEIIKHKYVNNYLILMINYPDCINYEGNKILVFENCTLEQLKEQKLIDPHFCDNEEFFSPIARFEPTDRGWNMALKLCKSI
jgi:hypothetical protein